MSGYAMKFQGQQWMHADIQVNIEHKISVLSTPEATIPALQTFTWASMWQQRQQKWTWGRLAERWVNKEEPECGRVKRGNTCSQPITILFGLTQCLLLSLNISLSHPSTDSPSPFSNHLPLQMLKTAAFFSSDESIWPSVNFVCLSPDLLWLSIFCIKYLKGYVIPSGDI